MSVNRDSVTFTINGQTYTAGSDYHPATSVLKFMRSNGISVGTKVCCKEGGCGVCAVTAKLYDPITKTKKSRTVNSCCLLLNSCDGAEITTVEGLGNTRDGLHPLQDRLAKFDGAQCGYCTPAQVMNMYGVLENNPTPTMEECEDAFDSSICRCTGYRPILDAMKSFAVDAPAQLKDGLTDVEDLGVKLCAKTGQPCQGTCAEQSAQPDGAVSSVEITGPMGQWLQPRNLSELYGLIKQHEQDKYRLVFGNTAFGVNKSLGPWNYQVLIDLRAVQELYDTDLTLPDTFRLGSNLTLQDLLTLFKTDSGLSALPYKDAFVKHLKLTASTAIRNLGTWAGNLMLKKSSPEFASDIFLLLETVGATLTIGDSLGRTTEYTLSQFLTLDMTGQLIVAVVLPKYTNAKRAIKTFRTSRRLQTSYSYVCSGFNFELDETNSNLVISKPTIVFQGISGTKIHADLTEAYLVGKQLEKPDVLTEALRLLSSEILAAVQASTLPKPDYRVSLAVGHFYKFVLSVSGAQLPARLRSGGENLSRPVMTGTQDYGTDDPNIYPVSQRKNVAVAENLVTGEMPFLNDEPEAKGQLYAAPVLATEGNAWIDTIDASAALSLPGVVRFIQASDIPGENNFRAHGLYEGYTDELFSSGKINFAGQPIGVIVADNEEIAQTGAAMVKVTYKNIQEPILDIHDAIAKQSFLPSRGTFTKGDAQAAMAAAPHRVKGNSENGHQYHFFLENQTAVCTPNGMGGMDVRFATQWPDAALDGIANVLGVPNSAVTMENGQLGGAFGGKLFNMQVGAMCAVAAWNTKRPVKLFMDLHTNMKYQGKRTAWYYEYEIGFDDTGRILALIVTAYSDAGYGDYPLEANEFIQTYIDSAYYCPNWMLTSQPCKTNKPISTAMRAPATSTAMFHLETMLDHVSTYLKKDPLEVKKINFFQTGQTTLNNLVIKDIDILKNMVTQVETDIDLPARKKAVDDFNAANRWRKRGLHVMLNRYFLYLMGGKLYTLVTIHHTDGSVFVSHGGVDMGQGMNTKVIQTCAYKLGIPMEKIKVKKNSSVVSINSSWTAGTTTSELICLGVIQCCEELNNRLAPIRAQEPSTITWEELIAKSFKESVNLTAMARPDVAADDAYPDKTYNTYSVCTTEVELDVITGQYQIRQVDYLYDGGQSLNPNIDMGQLEGGFIMGCGLFLMEELAFDKTTGQLTSDGTWEYKPPLPKDLPIVFNAKFLRNAPNPTGILSSKAVGEAPVGLGSSAVFALKRAIEAARKEQGKEGWFPLYAPASVDRVHAACENKVEDFVVV